MFTDDKSSFFRSHSYLITKRKATAKIRFFVLKNLPLSQTKNSETKTVDFSCEKWSHVFMMIFLVQFDNESDQRQYP